MARRRAHPRISITKLAEYLVAAAGRRRTILVDQEFPSAFNAANRTEVYPIADVLAGEVFTAPFKSGQRSQDATAACSEIAVLCRHVEPETGAGGVHAPVAGPY